MTSEDVLSAGGRAGRNPPRGMTSCPEPFPVAPDIVSGDQSRLAAAGGAIGPATIRGDGPTGRQFEMPLSAGRNYYARA